jgi:U2 small nuclear ribonucleoprotein B''
VGFWEELFRSSACSVNIAMTAEPLPNKTLYVRNLNESVKLPILKQDLQTTFSQFGNVIDVVAHKNLRMRGQAFVIFDDQKAAEKAQQAVQGFSLHEKPIQVQFAKTPSDDTVKRDLGEEQYEEHKKQRLEIKGTRLQNELIRIELKKAHEATDIARKSQPSSAPARKPRPAQAHIPSQHLPPNKVLFLQNLPDSATKEGLVQVYSQFEGFREVRMVPGRKGIAFVEYDTESQAGMAKVNTSKFIMEDRQVSVTYQRKIN